MKSLLPPLFLVLAVSSQAQTPSFIHHFTTHEYAIMDFHESPLGGYLATVQVWDSIDVDPGPTAIWLEPLVGAEEGALVAYDTSGNYLWHKQLTSTEKVTIRYLTFTEDGQFYASGTVGGLADVDPGTGVAAVNCNCGGATNGWYGKYSASGDLLWHAQVGNGSASTSATVRVIYSPLSHDLFMFGEALGSSPTDYDPGSGIAEIPPPPVSGQGSTHFIFARLDSSGVFQWYKPWGTTALRQVTRWDDGVNEFFYLAGTSFGWNDPNALDDHDPGPGQVVPYHPVGTLQDVWASKFDANGNLVWCQFFFGGNGVGFGQNEGATDVAVDSQGNAYVAGRFVSNYTTTVGGSPLSLVPYGGAATDAILLKLSSADGSLIWEKQFGSPSDDTYGATCAVDELDRVYIGSTFVNTAELNSAGPTVQVTANGPMWTNDGFVASFDVSGQYLWSGTFGGGGTDGPEQLFPSANELCVMGYFTETADLDLGPGVSSVVAEQGNDPFFACYDLSGIAMRVDDARKPDLGALIYPNPASVTVNVKRDIGSFEVYDALGQRVWTARTGGAIDVSTWPSGVYHLNWQHEWAGGAVRFVVDH